jgi:CRP/FNR family cyclic AMP-dependent transcriptional regulator
VADAVIKRRFKRGETIVEQGEKSNTLFIILTGRSASSPPTSAAAR